jgi:hypothetical protein
VDFGGDLSDPRLESGSEADFVRDLGASRLDVFGDCGDFDADCPGDSWGPDVDTAREF